MLDLRIAPLLPMGADLAGCATREFVRDHPPLVCLQGSGLVGLGPLVSTPQSIHLCRDKSMIRNFRTHREPIVVSRTAVRQESDGSMRQLWETEVMMMRTDFREALV
jgi:hypothetical protein